MKKDNPTTKPDYGATARRNRLRLHRTMPDYPQGSGHGRGGGDN